MKKNLKKLIAFCLAWILTLSTFACNASPETEPISESETEPSVPETDAKEWTYGMTDLPENPNPFYPETVGEQQVVDLFTTYLFGETPDGKIVFDGANGESYHRNGETYLAKGLGTVTMKTNNDGTGAYFISIQEGATFSDGSPVTIDDVIFSFYVLLDPLYNGPYSTKSLPIVGLPEYHAGVKDLFTALFEAGEGNTDFTYWDEETQKDFFTELKSAGKLFAQEIIDYVMENYGTEEYVKAYFSPDFKIEDVEKNETFRTAYVMSIWGFGDITEGTVFADANEKRTDLAEEKLNAEDFWNCMYEAYEGNITELSENETAGSDLLSFFDGLSDYQVPVLLSAGAPTITGIKRVDDYHMTIKMQDASLESITALRIPVCPKDHYGNGEYDFGTGNFGIEKGHPETVLEKEPMGIGPYHIAEMSKSEIVLKWERKYFLGAPEIKTLNLRKVKDAEALRGVYDGKLDGAVIPYTKEIYQKLMELQDGKFSTDAMTARIEKDMSYGGIFVNPAAVKVGDDANSDSSRNLRKGFLTLMAVLRSSAVQNSFLQNGKVIETPAGTESFYCGTETGEAYAYDMNGDPIYSDTMTETERKTAAMAAAVSYFKEAGFHLNVQSGKFSDMMKTYEVILTEDSPMLSICNEASDLLSEIGVTLKTEIVPVIEWETRMKNNDYLFSAGAVGFSADPIDFNARYQNFSGYRNETVEALLLQGRLNTNEKERGNIYAGVLECFLSDGIVLPVYQRKNCILVGTKRMAEMPEMLTVLASRYSRVRTWAVK